MQSHSKMAKKKKGVRRQELRHRGVDPQAEGSRRQHRPHEPNDMVLSESPPTNVQLVASRKQENTPFNPDLEFSGATPAEIATINDACEGHKVESAAFICRLFEEIQKDRRVKEDDWVYVAVLGMRLLPGMMNLQEPSPQCAGNNVSLLRQRHDQQTMRPQGLDEVEIPLEDLELIIVWYRRNSNGRNMKGKLPMTTMSGGRANSLPGHSRSLLFSQSQPPDDLDPEMGVSRAWTLPDSDSGTLAGPSVPHDYQESGEEEEQTMSGMKGTQAGLIGVSVTPSDSGEETPSIMGSSQQGPADVTVTPDASEEETPSNMSVTQPHASLTTGLPITDTSQGPVSAAPDLAVEEALVGMDNPQELAGPMPNGRWGGMFVLQTLWRAVEIMSS